MIGFGVYAAAYYMKYNANVSELLRIFQLSFFNFVLFCRPGKGRVVGD